MAEHDDTPTIIPIPGAQSRMGGISRAMVYQLIDDGELVRVNIGSRAFITVESIDAFLARRIEAAKVSA